MHYNSIKIVQDGELGEKLALLIFLPKQYSQL